MTVREAHRDELETVLALRDAVFVQELGVTAAARPDADDAISTHLVATEAEEIVGVCRLVPGNAGPPARLRLGYLCVVQHARGRGVAAALLTDAAARALAGGFSIIVLHAQPEVVPLYERAGYTVTGRRVVLGMEHQVLELRVG